MLRFPNELALTTIDQVRALPSVSYEMRCQLPDEPGVYFLLVDGELAYIGESHCSLRIRWRNHHRSDLRRFGELRIAYICCDEGPACTAELYLIDTFNPPYNNRPSGSVTVEYVEGRVKFTTTTFRYGRKRGDGTSRAFWEDSRKPTQPQ